MPVVMALKTWDDRHLQPDGPWAIARHGDCTSPVEVRVLCPECGVPLTADDLETVVLRTI